MMLTFEQYGHDFKSARSLINSAFENLPTDEIIFNEVGDKLHVVIYASAITIDELEDALEVLQSKDILGNSIEVDEVVGHAYVKLIVDEKLLEGLRKGDSEYVFDYDINTEEDMMPLSLLNAKSRVSYMGEVPYTYYFAYSYDSKRGSDFLKDLKMLQNFPKTELDNMLNKAVLGLNDRHDLSEYDTVVYPESSSIMLKTLGQKVAGKGALHLYPDSFTKVSRSDLKFDEEKIKNLPERTKKQLERLKEKILKGEGTFRMKDVFAPYRKFILDFLKFNSAEDRRVYNAITDKRVILVDDYRTTGTTLFAMIEQLAALGPKEILVFVLIKVK